jgi:hypothetical protein
MDANRDKLRATIAGRHVVMYRPGEGQLLALTMASDESIPAADRYGAFTKMFTSLLPEVADRVWFLENLATGNYTLQQLIATLKAIATAPAPQDRPRKAVKGSKAKPAPVVIEPLDDGDEDDD